MNNLELTEIPLDDNNSAPIPLRKDKYTQKEKKYNEYIELCKLKRKLHLYSAKYYDKLFTKISLCIFILGSTNTFLASINTFENKVSSLSITVAVFTALHTVFNQVNQKLKYNTKSCKHLNCANLYSGLARKIEKELYKRDDAKHTIEMDFDTFHREFSNIEILEPLIPNWIEEKYSKNNNIV